MPGLFEPIIQNLESIVATGGYYTLFISLVLDSVPVIGVLVPGSTMIVVAGFLAHIGVLSAGPVIIIAVTGAILGDIIGYILGKRYGYAFLDSVATYVGVSKSYVDKARNAIEKNTAITVLIGRFSPVTRAFTPFAIGASGVKFSKFWVYDCIGSAGWALAFVLLGYIFGGSYSFIQSAIGTFSAVGIVSAILIIWGYRFINKTFHIWSRYELFALVANILSIYVFFKMLEDTVSVPSFLARLDVWINARVGEYVTDGIAVASHIVSTMGSPVLLGLGGFIIGVALYLRGSLRLALISVISTTGALFANMFIKDLVLRDRPLNAIVNLSDYSFPSTHTTMSAVMLVIVAYVMVPRIKRLWVREVVLGISFVFAVAIGVSRLALGVHWFSDVIAGYALGIFCGTIVILLIRYGSMIWQGVKRSDIRDKIK